jgi:hypothetical protein
MNESIFCLLADEELFIEFCEDFDYAPVLFEAFHTVNGERKLIYHTNVMMCLGENFAVIVQIASMIEKNAKWFWTILKG